MPKYVKKKALKNAIECCTWYHINKNGELVEGANSDEHEPLYKYSDIKRIIKGLPTRKFDDEPTISKMEQVEDEPKTDCSKCRHWVYDADCTEEWVCDVLLEGHECNYEPQTEGSE